MTNVAEIFPKDILHGSLLADGSLKARKTYPAFTIGLAQLQPHHKKTIPLNILLICCMYLHKFHQHSQVIKFFSLYKKAGDKWNFALLTRSLPLLNSYYKMFYPNFCFTARKSGVKQIPALSYLKTVLTSYETVGHFIFQNG